MVNRLAKILILILCVWNPLIPDYGGAEASGEEEQLQGLAVASVVVVDSEEEHRPT